MRASTHDGRNWYVMSVESKQTTDPSIRELMGQLSPQIFTAAVQTT
jgi:hypothetical protein